MSIMRVISVMPVIIIFTVLLMFTIISWFNAAGKEKKGYHANNNSSKNIFFHFTLPATLNEPVL